VDVLVFHTVFSIILSKYDCAILHNKKIGNVSWMDGCGMRVSKLVTVHYYVGKTSDERNGNHEGSRVNHNFVAIKRQSSQRGVGKMRNAQNLYRVICGIFLHNFMQN